LRWCGAVSMFARPVKDRVARRPTRLARGKPNQEG
jgi:hypothetical protein